MGEEGLDGPIPAAGRVRRPRSPRPAPRRTRRIPSPDVAEPGSVEAIAKFTTEPRFLSSWVSYVPASATVPSPTKFLGHVAGAEGELSRTAQIYGYFRALAKATPRVRVEVIGKSEEGREILLVAIADEEGIRNLDRLKAATAALADPRITSPEAAEKIVATARPIYYFNAGLHSTETGSPEMVMELAYRLAVSEQPMIRDIRKNLVVLINPVSEPDGRDKTVDWFYRYLKGKTDWENLPERTPAVLGLLRLPRQQPRHAPEGAAADAGRAPDVLRLPPDRRARPPRVDPAAAHVERHRSLQREPRSDRDLRVARDLVPRGPEPDVARHAGRLDLGLRRVVGAPLPRLGRVQPQLARPRIRDVRQRHGGDGRADAAPVGEPLRRHARDQPRVVPALAAGQEVPLVAPQQHELHGDRLPRDPRLVVEEREGHAPQLLPQGLQLLAEGREGQSLRLRDPAEPGRSAPRRADDRDPARAPDRGRAADRGGDRQGGNLREGRLRRSPRPALPQLRGRSAGARRSSRPRRRTSPTTTFRGR